MTAIPEITAATFKREVLDSRIPVLVDLYATWCPPCRLMGQLLEKVAPRLAGRAKVVKINIEDQPELAAEFGVPVVPTLVLVHRGDSVDSHAGLLPADAIVQMVEKVTSPAPARG